MSSMLWPGWLPLRDDLRGQSPYGAPQHDVAVRLNTNENPYGPSSELVTDIAKEVAAIAAELNRYPDRDALGLRAALADYVNQREELTIGLEQVWAANGSNEVIQQLLMACGGPGRAAIGFVPSYSMHELIAKATNTEWIAIPRTSDFSIKLDAAGLRELRPAVVFVTSPNNPTGTAISPALLRDLAVLTQEVNALLVIDEAYAEFARDGSISALHLQPEFPHVVVLRTMSKAFALAGARVGYLVAHPSVVAAVQLVRLPYHLSSLAQAVGMAALRHASELLATVEQVRSERDRLSDQLHLLGLDVIDSDANFVLFGTFSDQSQIWRDLLDAGVLVRDVGLAGYLRVTAGTPAENDRFLAALAPLVQPADPSNPKERS